MKLTWLLGILPFLPNLAEARDVELSSPEERIEYIRRADVWKKPSWIADDFTFDPNFNIKAGQPVSGSDRLLLNDEISCLMTEELAVERSAGKTNKFFCQLMQRNESTGRLEVVRNAKGKAKKIKVKYDSYETHAEVLGTRLMWALGFGADTMFPIKKVTCYGCSPHPFKQRFLDRSSLETGRVFEMVVTEAKMEGEEIRITEEDEVKPAFAAQQARAMDGWSYKEILKNYSSDRGAAREQIIERDALLLMAAFVRHNDNKVDNHRLLCEGEVSEDGKCLGTPRIYIHDMGLTFGWGAIVLPPSPSRADLNGWRSANIWMGRETEQCRSTVGLSQNMTNPTISEEARQLVAKLLNKFVEGSAGQKRLRDLIEVARLEQGGRGTTAQWMQAFMEKIDQINHPALSRPYERTAYDMYTGRETRETRMAEPVVPCNRRADDVLRRVVGH